MLALAACGGSSAATERPWRANANDALRQLHEDVAATTTGGGSVAAARRALRNESDLYGLVVAYTDLGGCRSMMRNLGAPPAVEARLALPCARLEAAAGAFADATARSDPRALVRAARLAASADRLLVEALATLRKA